MAETTKKTAYTEGIGRRKSASARVRIAPASRTSITVNEKPFEEYFKHAAEINNVRAVLNVEEAGVGDYAITVHVSGGGLSAQAEAIRLGIARALVGEKADRRGVMKKEGYLKRDPRSVERKKFGLKKARKRPAWSKR